jgi:hypothetical protein
MKQADECRAEANFLSNVGKFVDWPPGTFRHPDEALAICVLGEDPFGRTLDDAVAGKSIDGHPLLVRRVSDARQSGGCHILFVNASEGKSVLATFRAARQRGVLTVGESGKPASADAIIKFAWGDGRVHFEINLAEAQVEDLRISSKLLSLATW